MPLRLIFMGTPAFAVPCLLEIIGHGYELAGVYSRAPKPAGRGLAPKASPVACEAQRFGLPVLTPPSLKAPDAAATMRALQADAAVVVAYGLILPKPILEAVGLGCFNVHASLLPRWRGAAPINRAIMAGDVETGVTIMKIDEGLDTGPIAMAQPLPIGPDATLGEVHDALARLGADLLVRALGALDRGALRLQPQPAAGATTAAKIDSGETGIDWSEPASRVHNHCRGLSPFPGAWFETVDERGTRVRVKVLRTTLGEGSGPPGTVLDDRFNVACGAGAVRVLELQRAGRQVMAAEVFLRGLNLVGDVLRGSTGSAGAAAPARAGGPARAKP
jgi:methionyl-tRNA formyltransferase